MNLWQRIVAFNLTIGLAAGLLTVHLYHSNYAQIVAQVAGSLSVAFFVGTPIILLLSRFWSVMYHRRPPLNWLLIASSILACTMAGNLVLNLCSLALGLLPPNGFWSSFWVRVQFSATLAMIFGLGAIGYEALRRDLKSVTIELRNRQLEQERTSKLVAEAQLASLESHIRPHFLFNTLNTISSLIPEDPKLAEALIGKLAALLRLSLDSNQERVASLEKELKIVSDYLGIERARYGGRLRFRNDVPAELGSIVVPALSLQTLVENSVKYAVGATFEGAEIRVAALARDGFVLVKVSDDGPGFTAQAIRPGHGLDNLQQRLVALFGPNATLEISGEHGFATVSFCVPRTATRGLPTRTG